MLPDRMLVAGALSRAGIEIEPAAVPRAHYRAARALDRAHAAGGSAGYFSALCVGLDFDPAQRPAATAALSELADRSRSRVVLWSELTAGAIETVTALRRAGITVVVVTNSDGHAADNLRDSGFLSASGLDAAAVIDSAVVASEKPDRRIFAAALDYAQVQPSSAVHVGDLISTDVVGAEAAGITPIHLDPTRACRSSEHRHVRSLRGVWAHLRL